MTNQQSELCDNARAELQPIVTLLSWSENYDFPSPASLFLDLIGYSEDEYGCRLCEDKQPSLGYLELSQLGAALTAYADCPNLVSEFLSSYFAAEDED